MKLGLICRKSDEKMFRERFEALGVVFDDAPELYLVEEEMSGARPPYIVFTEKTIDAAAALVLSTHTASVQSTLFGVEDDVYHVIRVDHILFIEVREQNTYCHTDTGVHLLKEKLYQLEAQLPSDRFIRVSRFYIVNIDAVVQIIPWFNRRLLLRFSQSKAEVEVSKNYVATFKAFLGMR